MKLWKKSTAFFLCKHWKTIQNVYDLKVDIRRIVVITCFIKIQIRTAEYKSITTINGIRNNTKEFCKAAYSIFNPLVVNDVGDENDEVSSNHFSLG